MKKPLQVSLVGALVAFPKMSRHFWLLAAVPIVIVAEHLANVSATTLFVLSVVGMIGAALTF